mmetsp:Transcript_22145/g.52418  ORF Transcript_22145/g.52418 Transcript_22145/m.52418 type:complete len:473 (-) Transcript_22145:193-1611(-)
MMLQRQGPTAAPWRWQCSSHSRMGRVISLFLLLQNAFVSTLALAAEGNCSSQTFASGGKNYHHMVILVHGYLGSYREQEYLSEALMREGRKALSVVGVESRDDENDESCWSRSNTHNFVVLNSKANSGAMELTADGVAKGGKRLASEVSDWVRQQKAEVQNTDSSSGSQTVMTLSFVGNSLGGLYSRYALTELETIFGKANDNDNDNDIHPLVFCTTSTPHLGVSQETFIELPKWTEPYVSSIFRQPTMDDLFCANTSTVITDMCHSSNASPQRDFLRPLKRFRKRIAMANAYNTDFLVSVASGAFLSSRSDSVHHHQDSDVVAASAIRLMKDMEHIALQVATLPSSDNGSKQKPSERKSPLVEHDTSDCVNALDDLGWLKIFVDTRSILPKIVNFNIPELEPRSTYTSRELQEHFQQYGTMLPIAHPLNMANSKTEWYRKMTQSGQPIVDALAELLVLDMIELSGKIDQES